MSDDRFQDRDWDEDIPDEEEGWRCERCDGTGYNKWGDVCLDCGGGGIIYDDEV